MPTITITLSREERADRRKQLAEAVRTHGDTDRAAREFGVSRDLVLRACRTFGVPYKKNLPPAQNTYALIAALLLDGISDSTAAERFGMSRQRVNTIRLHMRAAGIPFGIRTLLDGKKAKSKLTTKLKGRA